MSKPRQRFVDVTLRDTEDANRTPISGYLDCPLSCLEQAVEPVKFLVPSLSTTVHQAKEECIKTSPLLSIDQSAAIYLYTMQTTFYELLNKALREKNRNALKPWFPYIRLFMSALEQLPSITGTVWRGVNRDVSLTYDEFTPITWWSFNSCSRVVTLIEAFTGLGGAMFTIECKNGKDISNFSAIKDEKEILLIPGTRLRMVSSTFLHNFIHIFHMIEEEAVLPVSDHALVVFQKQTVQEYKRTPNYRNKLVEDKIKLDRQREYTSFYGVSSTLTCTVPILGLARSGSSRYRYDQRAVLPGARTFTHLILTDDDIGLIADEIKQNRTWQYVSLSQCQKVTHVGAYYIAQALANQPTLKMLTVHDALIQDEGAISLAHFLKRNQCIKQLFLQSCSVRDRGALAMAEMLLSNSALQELWLGSNEVGNEGCIAICQALHTNCTLQHLGLADNLIAAESGDSIVAMLKHNATLRRLTLKGNPIVTVSNNFDKIRQAVQLENRCELK